MHLYLVDLSFADFNAFTLSGKELTSSKIFSCVISAQASRKKFSNSARDVGFLDFFRTARSNTTPRCSTGFHVRRLTWLWKSIDPISVLPFFGHFCSVAWSSIFHEQSVVFDHLTSGEDWEKSILKDRNVHHRFDVANTLHKLSPTSTPDCSPHHH